MIGAKTRVGWESSICDFGESVRWSGLGALDRVFLGLIQWSVPATGRHLSDDRRSLRIVELWRQHHEQSQGH